MFALQVPADHNNQLYGMRLTDLRSILKYEIFIAC